MPTAKDSLPIAVPAALELGWTMATLYTPPGKFGMPGVDHLPTENELPTNDRIGVELDRLPCLLRTLTTNGVSLTEASRVLTAIQTAWTEGGTPDGAGADEDPKRVALHSSLRTLNQRILEGLACAADEVELGYEVGRSLRDTASLPKPVEDMSPVMRVLTGLDRKRTSTIGQWLATLSPHLPSHSAAIVGTSLSRWSEVANASLNPGTPGKIRRDSVANQEAFAKQFMSYLLRQGDVWLRVLTGSQSTDGLLEPEGYVAAGELALTRSTRIVKGILWHYSGAIAVVAAALGGALYFASTLGTGAGKVWTQIAAIATSLGVTARGVASTAARLSKEAERPIFSLEEEDVMAWAITALPPVRLNHPGVRALRRAGIAPSWRLPGRSTKDRAVANEVDRLNG